MRFDKNATIAGQPIKRVRELLRRMGSAHWSHREIADFFHIDDVKAHALIDEMAVRGFLQESERRPGNSSRFYECGPQGPRLGSARLLKAITRQKADVIIATLLQRVERVNARPELLERVCEVRIFGSYLEERDDFGDIDVAVGPSATKDPARIGFARACGAPIRPAARSAVTSIDSLMAIPKSCVC